MRPQQETSDLPEPDDSILERAGENPLRFLAMNELDTALGLIRGIRDQDRLDAWREAEMEHVDPPRDRVLNALRKRERVLNGKPAEADPEPTPADPEPNEPAPEPAQAHDEVSDILDVGSVLVSEYGEKVEYIWPATERAESPYVSRTFEDGDRLWMELDVDEETVRKRRRDDAEIREVSNVTVEPPADAATEVTA